MAVRMLAASFLESRVCHMSHLSSMRLDCPILETSTTDTSRKPTICCYVVLCCVAFTNETLCYFYALNRAITGQHTHSTASNLHHQHSRKMQIDN